MQQAGKKRCQISYPLLNPNDWMRFVFVHERFISNSIFWVFASHVETVLINHYARQIYNPYNVPCDNTGCKEKLHVMAQEEPHTPRQAFKLQECHVKISRQQHPRHVGQLSASTVMTEEINMHQHIPHFHPQPPPKVIVADPVMCNPNSFQTLLNVLRTIGSRCGIKRYGTGNREWITVYMDGLPYYIIINFIFNTLYCTDCECGFFPQEDFTKHCNEKHANK